MGFEMFLFDSGTESGGSPSPSSTPCTILSDAVQHVLWWFERTTSVKRLHNAAITTELSRPTQSLGPYVREDQKELMKPLLDFSEFSEIISWRSEAALMADTVGLVSSLQYTFASSFVAKWRDDSVREGFSCNLAIPQRHTRSSNVFQRRRQHPY